MSFDLTGSLYNQAVQTKKAALLTGSQPSAKSQEYTLSFSNAYDKTLQFEEKKTETPVKNKIDFIA